MKFYDCATAPSPRRVRIFLAEKGMSVPTVQVNLREGEHLKPAFRAVNPDCTVPVLELNDGTRLTDAIAICRYIEEVRPEPPLMGEGPAGKALVEAAQRQAERDGFYAVMEAFRNARPGLKGRALPGPEDYEQIPALAERGRARVRHFFARMDTLLADRRFVVGQRYTIADITLFVTVGFAAWAKLPMPEECQHLRRWHEEVGARPSAKA